MAESVYVSVLSVVSVHSGWSDVRWWALDSRVRQPHCTRSIFSQGCEAVRPPWRLLIRCFLKQHLHRDVCCILRWTQCCKTLRTCQRTKKRRAQALHHFLTMLCFGDEPREVLRHPSLAVESRRGDVRLTKQVQLDCRERPRCTQRGSGKGMFTRQIRGTVMRTSSSCKLCLCQDCLREFGTNRLWRLNVLQGTLGLWVCCEMIFAEGCLASTRRTVVWWCGQGEDKARARNA